MEEDDETARDDGDWDEIAELSASLDEVSALSSEEIVVGCRTLRKLGKKIHNSLILQVDLADVCKSEHIEVKKMIRAVDTRWNTLCNVIERALELRCALYRLLSQGKHKQGKKPLSLWRLSMEEWDLLKDILPMLKVFHQATKRLSTSGCPLVADIIPVIDLINQRLENLVNDFTKPSIVRASAAKVLHPKYKTHYFDKAQWESNWKDMAISILREEWDLHYKSMIDELENGTTPLILGCN
ncbi:hypothetical protein EV360DRAFT_76283 [Lentinula raphanica]|nr:hypothetical protein EV360DRAFT_76283 [Lentinula raphanica]